jgi:hypothetical protein
MMDACIDTSQPTKAGFSWRRSRDDRKRGVVGKIVYGATAPQLSSRRCCLSSQVSESGKARARGSWGSRTMATQAASYAEGLMSPPPQNSSWSATTSSSRLWTSEMTCRRAVWLRARRPGRLPLESTPMRYCAPMRRLADCEAKGGISWDMPPSLPRCAVNQRPQTCGAW